MNLRGVQLKKAVFLVLLTFNFIYKRAQSQLIACTPHGEQTEGFTARFYPYEINDQKAINSLDYINGGYLQDAPIGMSDGIVEPYFNIRPCVLNKTQHVCDLSNNYTLGNDNYYSCGKTRCQNLRSDVVSDIPIYGFPVTATNFTVELSGYLFINVSGLYTFSINSVHDAAGISIGAGTAFDCCHQNARYPSTNTSLNVVGMGPWTSNSTPISDTVYLFAGHYYPVRVVYVNIMNQGMMSTSMRGPDGNQIDDWGSMVYSFVSDGTKGEVNCIDDKLPETTQANTPITDNLNTYISTGHENGKPGAIIFSKYKSPSSMDANTYSTLFMKRALTQLVTLAVVGGETSITGNDTTQYITSIILSTLTVPTTITTTKLTDSTVLITLTVPETVTSTRLTDSTVLNTVTIPETVTSTILTDSTVLNTVTIPETVTETEITNSVVLSTVTIPETVTSTLLTDSTVLNTVTIPETVTSTKITNSTVLDTEIVSETITETKITNSVVLSTVTIPQTTTRTQITNSTILQTSIERETATQTETVTKNETSTVQQITTIHETITAIHSSTTVHVLTTIIPSTTLVTAVIPQTSIALETSVIVQNATSFYTIMDTIS